MESQGIRTGNLEPVHCYQIVEECSTGQKPIYYCTVCYDNDNYANVCYEYTDGNKKKI